MTDRLENVSREFIELRFDAMREYFDLRFTSSDKAVSVATTSLEKRLEGMNEFRDALKDQASRFVTRDELTLQLKQLAVEVDSLKISRAVMEGKASQSSMYLTMAISVASLFLGFWSTMVR